MPTTWQSLADIGQRLIEGARLEFAHRFWLNEIIGFTEDDARNFYIGWQAKEQCNLT